MYVCAPRRHDSSLKLCDVANNRVEWHLLDNYPHNLLLQLVLLSYLHRDLSDANQDPGHLKQLPLAHSKGISTRKLRSDRNSAVPPQDLRGSLP